MSLCQYTAHLPFQDWSHFPFLFQRRGIVAKRGEIPGTLASWGIYTAQTSICCPVTNNALSQHPDDRRCKFLAVPLLISILVCTVQ